MNFIVFAFFTLHGADIRISWLLFVKIDGEKTLEKWGQVQFFPPLLVSGGRASILVIPAFLYLEFVLLPSLHHLSLRSIKYVRDIYWWAKWHLFIYLCIFVFSHNCWVDLNQPGWKLHWGPLGHMSRLGQALKVEGAERVPRAFWFIHPPSPRPHHSPSRTFRPGA